MCSRLKEVLRNVVGLLNAKDTFWIFPEEYIIFSYCGYWAGYSLENAAKPWVGLWWRCTFTTAIFMPLRQHSWGPPKSLQWRLVLPSCRFPHHTMILCPTRRLLGTWGSTMWIIWLMNTCVTTFIILPGWRPASHRFPRHCICLGTDTPLSRSLLHPIPVRGACVEEVIGKTDSHRPVPS